MDNFRHIDGGCLQGVIRFDRSRINNREGKLENQYLVEFCWKAEP
jgi:hypothetical protein